MIRCSVGYCRKRATHTKSGYTCILPLCTEHAEEEMAKHGDDADICVPPLDDWYREALRKQDRFPGEHGP